MFDSSTKLTASDSDNEAFKSMHQSIMTKIKISASEDWIVIETIVKHGMSVHR